jgi:hypothetical protein
MNGVERPQSGRQRFGGSAKDSAVKRYLVERFEHVIDCKAPIRDFVICKVTRNPRAIEGSKALDTQKLTRGCVLNARPSAQPIRLSQHNTQEDRRVDVHPHREPRSCCNSARESNTFCVVLKRRARATAKGFEAGTISHDSSALDGKGMSCATGRFRSVTM